MVKTKKQLILFFLLLFALNMFTQGNTQEVSELKWPDNIVKGTLDNGFTYYIMKNEKPAGRVFADLIVKAGSIHEKDEERGMAHFIEHMAFNGSENFASGELVKYFESIGVDFGPDINAYTSFDRTVYSIEMPVEKEEYIDRGLLALSDYASGLFFLPEEVEKEKGIILEELRLGRDVSTRVFEQEIALTMKGSLYPDRLPIGTEETVSSFTDEDLKKFYSAWYRPDLMHLVLVGDYDPLEMEKKIKELFGKIPLPETEKPDLLVPFKPHDEIYTGLITDAELEETSLSAGYLREPEKVVTLEDFRRDICDTILFGIINRRFAQEEYKSDTPVVSSGAYISTWMPSMIETGFWCSAKPGRAAEALEVIMGYSEGFRNYSFSDVERKEVETELLESLRKTAEEEETIESYTYLSVIGDSAMRDNIYVSFKDTYRLVQELLPTITNEEIQSRIQYLFEPCNMSVIIEAPEKDRVELEKTAILPLVEKIMTGGGVEYELEALDYSYDYTSLVPGEVVSRKDYKELNLTIIELSNGLKVLLKPTEFDKDTVIINYSSLGGKLLQQPETPGMFAVSSGAWQSGGTEDLTQFEADRLMSSKNISLGMGGGVLYWICGSSSRNEGETLCQWMWQYLNRPGYSREGIDYSIKSVQENIRYYSQYLEGVMYEEEDKLLLPNNPLSVQATEEEVEKYTDPESLKTFQKLSFVPSNSELTILGAFEIEEGIRLACKYFGSLPAGEKPSIPSGYLETEFPQGNTERIVYKGLEEKCLGTVIFPACMYDDPEKPAVDFLADILDTRINHEIREEKSLAYSIWASQSSPVSIKGYGRFYVEFGCDPEKVYDVLDAVTAEIKDIKENGVTEEEMESTRKVILSDYKEAIETNEYWLSELDGITIFNYDPEELLKFEEKYSSVTAEQVRHMANKYLNEKNRVLLIGLPEETTEKTSGENVQ